MQIKQAIVLAFAMALMVSAARAENQNSFNLAFEAAKKANAHAGALKNQWTSTASTLKAAEAAAAAGDFDKATGLANHASALAEASVTQAEEQDKLWVDAVIH